MYMRPTPEMWQEMSLEQKKRYLVATLGMLQERDYDALERMIHKRLDKYRQAQIRDERRFYEDETE